MGFSTINQPAIGGYPHDYGNPYVYPSYRVIQAVNFWGVQSDAHGCGLYSVYSIQDIQGAVFHRESDDFMHDYGGFQLGKWGYPKLELDGLFHGKSYDYGWFRGLPLFQETSIDGWNFGNA